MRWNPRGWLSCQLAEINEKLGRIMSALTDLQAADAALQAEVAQFLQDVVTALQAEDPDIEAVVTDLNTQVANLKAGDPVQPAPPAGS